MHALAKGEYYAVLVGRTQIHYLTREEYMDLRHNRPGRRELVDKMAEDAADSIFKRVVERDSRRQKSSHN